MKFITKHETTAAYNAAKDGLAKPHVALIEENYTCVYEPYTPKPPVKHDYVEINGVKWATMNIGSTEVTDQGLYFQWADTQGYTAAQVGWDKDKTFREQDYKYFDSSTNRTTKYNSIDGLKTLESSDDAVTAAWGGNWRTPTSQEWDSLNMMNRNWTNDYNGSGMAGIVIDNGMGDELFFPHVGYVDLVNIQQNSSVYLTNEASTNNDFRLAFIRRFDYGQNSFGQGELNRWFGFVVRGVLDEKE